jgi:hypothetical protein
VGAERSAPVMTKRLAALFFYTDGCSLRLDGTLGDPPPRRILLWTTSKDGIARFRLKALHQPMGEAWYEEVEHGPSTERAGL